MSTPREPEVFCTELGPRLLGSLTLFCGDRLVAEELAQEALARAFERWNRVAEMAAPEAWVYRTAFNLARSGFRRRAAERRSLRRWAAGRPSVVEPPDTAAALTVRRLVSELPPRQRVAIVARYYSGLSVDETAEALSCAPGTVRALTHQAIVRLRAAGLSDLEDPNAEEQASVQTR